MQSSGGLPQWLLTNRLLVAAQELEVVTRLAWRDELVVAENSCAQRGGQRAGALRKGSLEDRKVFGTRTSQANRPLHAWPVLMREERTGE